jgi:hypothetical protein
MPCRRADVTATLMATAATSAYLSAHRTPPTQEKTCVQGMRDT